MVAKIVKSTESAKHKGDVSALFADGEHVFSGGADGLIKLWSHDLDFVRDIEGHTEYVLSLGFNSKGHLYSSARDGTLRYWSRPLKTNTNEILQQVVLDDITAVYCEDDLLYSGDDKGTVTKWYHHAPGMQYHIIEEVKALIVENNHMYTARDVDAVITDITPLGRRPSEIDYDRKSYTTKATIPGRAPLTLAGPPVDGHKKFLICTTREGKGITVVNNSAPYNVLWTKEDAHEWIINAICATEDSLFTADFGGKVKQWVNLAKGPTVKAEIDTGKCINAICNGPDNTVYVGDSEGVVKKISF